jgi:hypothetical protein
MSEQKERSSYPWFSFATVIPAPTVAEPGRKR